MAATREINLGVFATGSVDRLKFTIQKDGAAWVGIDSVTLTFEKPDRETTATVSLTNEAPDAGVWYYDTLVTDIPDAEASEGQWTAELKVVDGSITKFYPYEISFTVQRHP